MSKVKIPLDRYEELLDIESRVFVAVERIINQKYIRTEDILRILGTGVAVREADRIKAEGEKQKKEWEEKQGYADEYNADV